MTAGLAVAYGALDGSLGNLTAHGKRQALQKTTFIENQRDRLR